MHVCVDCLYSILGIYCSGWVKRGPVGVIVTTMNDAFETAETIAHDIEKGEEHVTYQHYGHHTSYIIFNYIV